jgi:hypothetical protein
MTPDLPTNDLDRKIIEAWEAHEAREPDISTERLMAMVEDDTGADVTRQLRALERAGMLK